MIEGIGLCCYLKEGLCNKSNEECDGEIDRECYENSYESDEVKEERRIIEKGF